MEDSYTYTVKTEMHEGKTLYIIYVNELPGICTDNESLEEGMEEIKDLIACAIEIYKEKGEPIPEPIDKNKFKGNIAYRTDSERHYLIAKTAQRMHKSISKTMDIMIDKAIEKMRAI